MFDTTYPMNEMVKWDPNEGIIGVLGLAPVATADFYTKLTALTPARKDWEHVRVIIHSNPKIPSRGRHLELGETDPSPYILRGILELAEQGACIVAIPCNTAHIFYEGYAAYAPVPVPNIIDVTVAALQERVGRLPPRNTLVLCSRQTYVHGLYHSRLNPLKGSVIEIANNLSAISNIIESVKQGRPLDESRQMLRNLIHHYPQAQAIILGCTELSPLISQDEIRIPLVDSNSAMAAHCLRFVKHISGPSENLDVCGQRKLYLVSE
jgi:aspartate racemase